MPLEGAYALRPRGAKPPQTPTGAFAPDPAYAMVTPTAPLAAMLTTVLLLLSAVLL